MLTVLVCSSVDMKLCDTTVKWSCVTLTENWITNHLLPKLVKWCGERDVTEPSADADASSCGRGSLRLVDVEAYYDRYRKMKDKYATAILKVGHY